jgi:HAE1 family hydrophobic/amphiphilic exporter-1
MLRGFERLMKKLEAMYVALLRWGLAHRALTMVLAVLSLVGALALGRTLGSEFVPQADNNELYVQFYTPVGSSLDLTVEKARQVEAALREFPEALYTYATINTGTVQGKNYATLFVRLKDRAQRARAVKDLVNPVRSRLAEIAGVTVTTVGVAGSFGSNKQIDISIQGPDQAQLELIAAKALEVMRSVPGVVDLDSSSKPAKPTVAIDINRALASDLGVGVGQIGTALRPLLAGEVASTWKAPDDENYDVRLRLPRDARRGIDDLERLALTSTQTDANGAPRLVPLRQVATLTPSEGPTQINRKSLTREVALSANVSGRPPGTVGLELTRRLKDEVPLPPGYAFVTGGATKDMQESFSYAMQALILAVTFIYMILASQFRSFSQPIAIMASLPLSLIGVMVALLAWRSTLNMFSVIGFIMLMGLVTKNAILLIDYANQRRREGLARTQALLDAAQVRLRPILMTTLAMVFGMLPLAVSTSEGSEQRAGMAHAVIGGVIASTLLTLLVVPVLYALLDGAIARLRGQPSGEPVK